jgi:membrane-bound lytic murein transglycosylase D
VAKRVGVSEDKLREANHIPPKYRLSPGSTILVPRDEAMINDIPATSLEARYSLVPENANLHKVTYRVRRGDTLAGVARRWKVDQKDIILWNRLTAPSLFAGQRLELTVPRPARRATAKAKQQPSATQRAGAKPAGPRRPPIHQDRRCARRRTLGSWRSAYTSRPHTGALTWVFLTASAC